LSKYAHLPTHWFYLYADEGSTMVQINSNWAPSKKFLDNSILGKNLFSPNNGPDINDSIKLTAGLQKQFQYLNKYSTAKYLEHPINEQRKETIEIIVTQKDSFDINTLKQIMLKSNMDTMAIYKWNNHYVLYDFVTDIAVLQGRLNSKLKGATVKVYHDMFYQFAKQKHCTNKSTAKEWTDIILTANLVADTAKQNLYYKYHNEQFEKWPTVAQGFCNADFQELNLFRNGRQLILVISIPKEKTLDELNPKTIENNKLMIEWNKQMGKFQEGIEGTKKGETWVFLNQISQ
jgi:hypothetical protein